MSDATNPPTLVYRISLAFPDGRQLIFPVDRVTILGRETEDVIDLTPLGADQTGVSRRHFEMVPNEDGIAVADLRSTNGSTLNGISMAPEQYYILRPRDVVVLGRLNFVVDYEIADAESVPMEPTIVNHVFNGSVEAARRDAEQRSQPQEEEPVIVSRKPGTNRKPATKVQDPEESGDKRAAPHGVPDTGNPETDRALRLLAGIVVNKEISDSMKVYVAQRSTQDPAWRHDKRLAVLRTACSFGYVARDNAELLQHERRANLRRFGNVE